MAAVHLGGVYAGKLSLSLTPFRFLDIARKLRENSMTGGQTSCDPLQLWGKKHISMTSDRVSFWRFHALIECAVWGKKTKKVCRLPDVQSDTGTCGRGTDIRNNFLLWLFFFPEKRCTRFVAARNAAFPSALLTSACFCVFFLFFKAVPIRLGPWANSCLELVNYLNRVQFASRDRDVARSTRRPDGL